MSSHSLRIALCGVALALGCHTSSSKKDGGGGDGSSQAQDDFAGTNADLTGTPPGADLSMTTGDMAQSTAGSASVLQRGNDIQRRATFTQPGLTIAAAATMAPDTTFNTNAKLPANGMMAGTTGKGIASVLYLEKGPAGAGCPAGATNCNANDRVAGAGLFFAFASMGATPNVFAIDETSGKTVWTANVSVGGNGMLADGVRGTPVIDAASRRMFLIGGPNPHIVHALSVDNGAEVTTGGWPVTLSSSTVTYNKVAFNSSDQNQRGALLLMNNILYIPFGGEDGDGGNYHGWVMALDITDTTKLGSWATQSNQSGIWTSGGLASDGQYVYAITGNTSPVARNVSDSEEVVRLSGMAAFSRTAANLYVPTEWQNWDSNDYDFGSSSAAVVPLPTGSKYSSFILAPAKPGRLYVLDGSNLSSGMYPTPGGHLLEMTVSGTNGQTVYTSPTVYSSASGLHAAINVGGGAVNCPGGNPSTQEAIVAISLNPNGTPVAAPAWCAAGGGNAGGSLNFPPISTTTDGVSANAIVWYIGGDNSNQLVGVDGDTGKNIVTTSGTSCDMIPSMQYAIAVKNRIVIAALGHLCSWSPGGK